jgi:hypothetical protein
VAVYKVPQDVEAEDKLIGPFSFRQFIYLIVVAISGFVGFLLAQVLLPLAIIVLPVILLFGALALPLRKDQPMETYLLAVIRFYFKPKRRMWDPEGAASHIEITTPPTQEHSLIKDFDQEVAQQRLDYLARVMDSRGWSLKGVNKTNESISAGVAAEAANAFDIMDDHADLAKSFDTLLAKKTQENRQALVQRMTQPAPAPTTPAAPVAVAPAQPGGVTHQDYANNPYDDVLSRQFQTPPNAAVFAPTPPAPTTTPPPDDNTPSPRFNPYPNAIHQKVVSPYHVPSPTSSPMKPLQKAEEPAPVKPLTQTVSPDIMRLASNNDLSISAIAHEAHRLQDGDEGEVVIKLH